MSCATRKQAVISYFVVPLLGKSVLASAYLAHDGEQLLVLFKSAEVKCSNIIFTIGTCLGLSSKQIRDTCFAIGVTAVGKNHWLAVLLGILVATAVAADQLQKIIHLPKSY